MIVELIVRDVELSTIVVQRTNNLLVAVARSSFRSKIMHRRSNAPHVRARVGSGVARPTAQCW
eukprot:8238387-Heterocapsa_arctica.AAC.1